MVRGNTRKGREGRVMKFLRDIWTFLDDLLNPCSTMPNYVGPVMCGGKIIYGPPQDASKGAHMIFNEYVRRANINYRKKRMKSTIIRQAYVDRGWR
jgi:hypothetical protein